MRDMPEYFCYIWPSRRAYAYSYRRKWMRRMRSAFRKSVTHDLSQADTQLTETVEMRGMEKAFVTSEKLVNHKRAHAGESRTNAISVTHRMHVVLTSGGICSGTTSRISSVPQYRKSMDKMGPFVGVQKINGYFAPIRWFFVVVTLKRHRR